VPIGHRVYLSWPEGASLVLPADAADPIETGEDEKLPNGGR
jgi:hypothetical protein